MRLNYRFVGAILLLIVAGYGFFKALPLIRGPYIRISSLTTNQAGLTSISGTAVHTDSLSMDGGTLLIDGNGAFKTTLTLPRGGAILTLAASDRFGRTQVIQKPVITP